MTYMAKVVYILVTMHIPYVSLMC